MMEAQTLHKRTPRDLAEALGVTPAAIYAAIQKGHVPAIPVGRHFRLTPEAFDYHAQNGYGPSVPPFPGK